jgi:hypothetical protein
VKPELDTTDVAKPVDGAESSSTEESGEEAAKVKNEADLRTVESENAAKEAPVTATANAPVTQKWSVRNWTAYLLSCGRRRPIGPTSEPQYVAVPAQEADKVTETTAISAEEPKQEAEPERQECEGEADAPKDEKSAESFVQVNGLGKVLYPVKSVAKLFLKPFPRLNLKARFGRGEKPGAVPSLDVAGAPVAAIPIEALALAEAKKEELDQSDSNASTEEPQAEEELAAAVEEAAAEAVIDTLVAPVLEELDEAADVLCDAIMEEAAAAEGAAEADTVSVAKGDAEIADKPEETVSPSFLQVVAQPASAGSVQTTTISSMRNNRFFRSLEYAFNVIRCKGRRAAQAAVAENLQAQKTEETKISNKEDAAPAEAKETDPLTKDSSNKDDAALAEAKKTDALTGDKPTAVKADVADAEEETEAESNKQSGSDGDETSETDEKKAASQSDA